MRFPKELCLQRSTQSDIDMLSSWCLSLRMSRVVDRPELRSWFFIFFPLLLPLSNFSLSSRNDLLLLFLVQSLIFLSKVSQNLSGNTCWRAPWRSPVWNLADRECLDWGENYDCEWGWKGMQGETTLENWHFWKTCWCSLIFQHRYLFFCFFLDWE